MLAQTKAPHWLMALVYYFTLMISARNTQTDYGARAELGVILD